MAQVVPLFPISKPDRSLRAAVQPQLAHHSAQPKFHRIGGDAEVSGDGLIRSAVASEAADDIEFSRAERGAAALIIAFGCAGSMAIGFFIAWVVGVGDDHSAAWLLVAIHRQSAGQDRPRSALVH